MSTYEDTTAAMVTDLATATELIHAVAREARSTAPEFEAADLYSLGAVLDELTSTLAHISDQCATHVANYPHGRILRDDTGTHNPAARCAEAADTCTRPVDASPMPTTPPASTTSPSGTSVSRCSGDLAGQVRGAS